MTEAGTMKNKCVTKKNVWDGKINMVSHATCLLLQPVELAIRKKKFVTISAIWTPSSRLHGLLLDMLILAIPWQLWYTGLVQLGMLGTAAELARSHFWAQSEAKNESNFNPLFSE